jgi:hypothetical protein
MSAAALVAVLGAGTAAAACPTFETRGLGFTLSFGAESSVRVLRYAGADIVYESIQPNSKPVEVVARHGLLVRTTAGSFGSNVFDYTASIEDTPAPATGRPFSAAGTITRSAAGPQSFEFLFEFGGTEVAIIGACRYNALNIIRTNTIDGQTAKIHLLFIPELMVSARTLIQSLGPDGTVRRETRFTAVSIDQ